MAESSPQMLCLGQGVKLVIHASKTQELTRLENSIHVIIKAQLMIGKNNQAQEGNQQHNGIGW